MGVPVFLTDLLGHICALSGEKSGSRIGRPRRVIWASVTASRSTSRSAITSRPSPRSR